MIVDAPVRFVPDDGGRADAGFHGTAGDCVTRAIAIATGKPYREVYDALFDAQRERLRERGAKPTGRHASPRNGVPKRVYEPYLFDLGWWWEPTMSIGAGCRVHLRADELPAGRIIVRLSKHLAAVIDGALHDSHDSSRDGTRCVYGIYRPPDW